MQKSDTNNKAVVTHRRMQTLASSRRNLQRPATSGDVRVNVKTSKTQSTQARQTMQSPQASQAMQGQTVQAGQAAQVSQTQTKQSSQLQARKIRQTGQKNVAPLQAAINNANRQERVDMSHVNERMRMRNSTAPAATTQTAKQMKEAAIEKAMKTTEKQVNQVSKKESKSIQMHFGFGRIMLALACAAAAVFAIVYFVNLNAPDISLKVAAMQTGIEASYPSYVPRDYSLSDITSEEGKIVLNFKKAGSDEGFSLAEESSSWDSNALLTNYVKNEYGSDYSVIKEQGLTLYINGSDACWVNGGVVYKLKATSGTLTKKQIKSIAVSL